MNTVAVMTVVKLNKSMCKLKIITCMIDLPSEMQIAVSFNFVGMRLVEFLIFFPFITY